MNGCIERSSHHGIHGNAMTEIILYNLVIKNFEIAGIALNGASNSILYDISIKDNAKKVPIRSEYS